MQCNYNVFTIWSKACQLEIWRKSKISPFAVSGEIDGAMAEMANTARQIPIPACSVLFVSVCKPAPARSKDRGNCTVSRPFLHRFSISPRCSFVPPTNIRASARNSTFRTRRSAFRVGPSRNLKFMVMVFLHCCAPPTLPRNFLGRTSGQGAGRKVPVTAGHEMSPHATTRTNIFEKIFDRISRIAVSWPARATVSGALHYRCLFLIRRKTARRSGASASPKRGHAPLWYVL